MSSTSISASQVITIPQTGMTFTAPPEEVFDESQYTIVAIVSDQSGSIYDARGDIFGMNEVIDGDLKKGSAKNTIVIRRTTFTKKGNQLKIAESHGFLPVTAVDPQAHFPIIQGYDNYGGTPLADGVLNGILAAKTQAVNLVNNMAVPLVNLVIAVVTDGGETGSDASNADIKAAIEDILAEGDIESITTILVGVKCPVGSNDRIALEKFQRETGFTKFIPFDEMTPKTFGKVAHLISKSISTTSQALGTGGGSSYVSGLQSGVSADLMTV